jgi:hypothetical protein
MPVFKHSQHVFPDLTLSSWTGEREQTLKARLFIDITLKLDDDESGQKSVLIALASEGKGNTLFEPGQLAYTVPDKLGWWLNQLFVWITPDHSMALSGSWPTTLNGSGQTGSSLSFSAGFFGPTETGGASSTTSNGHSYQDFTLGDTSDGFTLRHAYKMSLCADGTPYHSPRDMVPDQVLPLAKLQLHGAPPLAIQDFPLVDMGIWTTQAGMKGDEVVTFLVSLQAEMACIAIPATANVLGQVPNAEPMLSTLAVVQQRVTVTLSDVG